MEAGFQARTVDLGEGIASVAITGEADVFTAPELKEALAAAIAGGAKDVVVDLSEATFVDSTTLGLLIGTVRRVDPLGGTVAVAVGDPSVARIFEITRLDQVFAMFDSMDAALAYLRDPNRAQR
jgi:anti-sigma B factor antagonist